MGALVSAADPLGACRLLFVYYSWLLSQPNQFRAEWSWSGACVCACVSLDAVTCWFPASCGHLTIRVYPCWARCLTSRAEQCAMHAALAALLVCAEAHMPCLCHVQPKLLGRNRHFCAQAFLCADTSVRSAAAVGRRCTVPIALLCAALCCGLQEVTARGAGIDHHSISPSWPGFLLQF